MNRRVLLLLFALSPSLLLAAPAEEKPRKVVTTADFRELLLSTKWTWRNVIAGVPDRECVFLADGTFRHPNFVAKFTIKNTHVVELRRKGEKATMTFDDTYSKFEAIDFADKRITGSRVQ